MSNLPLVSIIIPVYNGKDYLNEAIDSALAQTYANIEVLVINDGSCDDNETERIALSYGTKIRYFRKENGGVATALNLGVNEMKGDYFSWLSHDDAYLPHKIETQINYLKTLSDKVCILYSDFCYIDEDSNFKSEFRVRKVDPKAFRLQFIMGGLIHGCTLLIPSHCFKELGLFNYKLRTTQDYDLWFRFSKKFDFVHIPEILIKSRIHSKQDTVKLNSLVRRECNDISLYFIKSISKNEILAAYSKPVSLYYFSFAKAMLSQGYREAMRYAFFIGVLNFTGINNRYFKEFLVDARRLSREVGRDFVIRYSFRNVLRKLRTVRNGIQ